MTSPSGPSYRFVCPPTWPQPPAGWVPPPGWRPDPAWGPAPEGWQFWQPAEAGPAMVPTDGFAIATLVAGVLGSFIFAGIFGGVSLSRIRRGLRRGRNLVFIGWGLCGLWLVAVIVLFSLLSAEGPGRAPSGEITAAGKIAPMSLQIGDCLTLPATVGGAVVKVDAVPCSSAHNAQVFNIVNTGSGPYPGENQATEMGLTACEAELGAFYGEETDIKPGTQLLSFTSAEADWNRGDHTSRCLVMALDGSFTGDIRDR